MMEDHIFEEREELFAALALEICTRLTDAVAARGRASLVATGGTTPGPLYDALAEAPAPWDRVEVTLTDERWVASDDDASNEALVRRRLLQGRAASALLVGFKTPHAHPGDAEPTINHALAGMPRPFDVTILGMGDDGHIASLFPHSKALERASNAPPDLLVCAVNRPQAAGAAERLSMTLPAILDSRWIVLLIEGAAKLDLVRQAREPGKIAELPVRAVLNQAATPVEVWWAP